jgi:hypothetical protein
VSQVATAAAAAAANVKPTVAVQQTGEKVFLFNRIAHPYSKDSSSSAEDSSAISNRETSESSAQSKSLLLLLLLLLFFRRKYLKLFSGPFFFSDSKRLSQ